MLVKYLRCFVYALLVLMFTLQFATGQRISSKVKNVSSINTENLSTQFLTIMSDVESGRFSLTDAKDVNLLYNHPEGLTSYINVFIDGKIYTSNSLHGPQSPPFTWTLPHPSFTRFANRLQYEWQIPTTEGGVIQLIQELIPRYDTTLEAALLRIRLTINNLDIRSHQCGVLTVLDMMLAHDDGPTISIDSVDRSVEVSIKPIPKRWDARSTSTSRTTFGLLSGLPELTIPDDFVVGRWQYDGYLGSVAWNYNASGMPLNADNAVLIGWNEKILQAGKSFIFATDYGYTVPIESGIFCAAPKRLVLCEGGKDYNPNPFPIAVQIYNQSSFSLYDLKATISLPSRTSLVSGSTTQNILPQRLLPGMTTTAVFMVKVIPKMIAETLHFQIDVSGDYGTAHCTADVQVPSTRIMNYAITLPNKIEIDGLSRQYKPFDLEVPITNNLCTGLRDVKVTLSMPSEAHLVDTPNPTIINTIPSLCTNTPKFKLVLDACTRDTLLEIPLTIQNEFEEIKTSVFIPIPSIRYFPTNIRSLPDDGIQFDVYPNIFRNVISVSIYSANSHQSKLYFKDLLGRTHWEQGISVSPREDILLHIPTDDCIPGLYFLFLETEKYIVVKKVLRLR